ncbi:endonuclease/exonuclease/phosphatase (EEP) superfamily protein YafD [Caulobacter ginsengisoli]|uniref:Endonuclease/exonuclease/phosphatase (EEP) superfamily protein YafD n=1 Tax=Caulobacter ginsengisoli TaxID=400775 RepID=A0ABU0IPL6_9CAUL|nr:endonuclease/exonuclease/phosphatase family protein [Caulobacter ginsengisoli]MDQ0463947.1 endonuclease/exonuclease/phosphatase (EEP) superfamily protein YafD [Caulobacter ginsengisoli]
MIDLRELPQAARRLTVRVARAFILLLALGCAVTAGLALLGRFSDRLDVLAHFSLVWLAGGLVCGAAWLVDGRRHGERATGILAAITLLALTPLMLPEMARGVFAQRVKPRSETLKLVQFNLSKDNPRPSRAVAWILAEDADVVTLEEVVESTSGVPYALRQRYPYQVSCLADLPCSTMVLSKRAPAAQGRLGMPDTGRYLSAAWMTLPGQGGPFTVVATHMTWPVPVGPQRYMNQRLAEATRPFRRDSLIVGGDFNSTPWSRGLRRMDGWLGLDRRTHGLASWPTALPRVGVKLPVPLLAIDQVYAGKSWKTVSVKRGPALGSDHYPVVVVLTRGP